MTYEELAQSVARLYRALLRAIGENARCPSDILDGSANALGYLRRVPGQEFYRAPPAGSTDTPPSLKDLETFEVHMKILVRRARELCKK